MDDYFIFCIGFSFKIFSLLLKLMDHEGFLSFVSFFGGEIFLTTDLSFGFFLFLFFIF